jgi:Ca2+:H+ antiporter
MSSAVDPAELEADNVGLLDGVTRPSRPLWAQSLLYVYHVTKAILCCSSTNFLLVFVPLGIISAALGWNSSTVFILNFLAMFPLATLLSYSTEELSANVGQTFGGLINASFGNAVEMIVSRSCIVLG